MNEAKLTSAYKLATHDVPVKCTEESIRTNPMVSAISDFSVLHAHTYF